MIRIFNTLSSKIEDFVPQGDLVKMYVCGVTPQAESHLGHAMSYIVFDMIKRYLGFRGHPVKHVQNFTDIDDKIILRAQQLGIKPEELAERYIKLYFENMDSLNIGRADIYPRATQEIPKIIEMTKCLVERDYAYTANGDVYFRVLRDPDYGKLSHRSLEGMMAGARIEVSEIKEHPLDFALWKSSKPGEPSWPSPWGDGRPGWHIECSAMALKYLGQTIDIHGGGQDLIFPHHENEIAQSESCTSVKPFVRYWVHNGLMHIGEEKMSKSTGRLVSVSEALQNYSPDAIRLWVLSSHYRSPIVYSDEIIASMEKGAERLRRTANIESHVAGVEYIDSKGYREKFIEAMDYDFGTPQALSLLFDLARDINRAHDEGMSIATAQETLRCLGDVLGFTFQFERAIDLPLHVLEKLADRYGIPRESIQVKNGQAGAYVEALVDRRAELRRAKDWKMADAIRNDLQELGVTLEDTPEGTAYRFTKP